MEARTSCDIEHDFALVLTGLTELTTEAENALFEAGCDDATLSVRFGAVYLTFARVAPSLKDAILTAILDVRKANIGADVLRIDACDLITQAEIARRIDRSRQLVNQYITGQRGPGGFPAPACHITEGKPLWLWCEVAYWLRQNNMIKEQDLTKAQTVETINCILDYLHQSTADPKLIEELLGSLKVSQVAQS